MTRFCINEDGWGPWSNQRYLDFTLCYEDSVIVMVPHLAVILFGLWRYQWLKSQPEFPNAKQTVHYLLKKIALVLYLTICIVSFLWALLISFRNEETVVLNNYVVAEFVSTASAVMAFSLTLREHSRSRTSSTVLLFFWLATFLVSIVKLRTLVLMDTPHTSVVSFVLFALKFALVIPAFFTELWHKESGIYLDLDTDYLDSDQCPEDTANIFSRITFSWITPLMRIGATKPLTIDDLWSLRTSDRSGHISADFQKAWDKEIRKHEAGKGEPSLVKTCAITFGGPFAFAGLFKLFQDCMAFVQPQLLNLLIEFVNSYSTDDPQPGYKGYTIAICMLLTALIQSAFLHQYFQLTFVTGMRVRAALVTAIYRKSIRLSSAGRQKSTVGEIVNYMSVDAQRITDLSTYLHICWSGPFQITLALVFLYRTMGPSVFAGVAMMILMIPVNALLATRQRRFQRLQMGNKDTRTKLMDEILQGIKVIKLYAFEQTFFQKVLHVRNDLELATLKKIGYLSAVQSFTWACTPFLVSFASFGTYTLLGNSLTPQLVFVSLSLFNLLQFPMSITPSVISSIVESSVSIYRLYDFFMAEELNPHAVERKPYPTPSEPGHPPSDVGSENSASPSPPPLPVLIKIQNGEFRWDSRSREPVLANINLEVKKGQLIACIGRVGAGKTSLISAILGDLYRSNGSVVVYGKVAYAPQAPWIMNATLRENILFGHKYDAEYYQATLDACCLRQDLEMLPGSDLTEIGERGINLSGGQKARISLARAVYSRADVYLLDDPLSAVDAHVGRHIFENVIGPKGLLKTKGRVFVTHQIHHLSQSDNILMLRAGQVIAQGRFHDLMKTRGALHALVTEYDVGQHTPTESESNLASNLSLESIGASEQPENSSSSDLYEEEGSMTSINVPHPSNVLSSRASLVDEVERRREQMKDRKSGTHNDKIIQQETSAVGSVDWGVYWAYASSCSPWSVVLYLSSLISAQAVNVGSNIFLKHWAGTTVETNRVWQYLLAYGSMGVLFSLLTINTTVVLWVVCAIKAAAKLHQAMLTAVIRSPMSFFDTTPLGRILNRFSKDVVTVDETLPRSFGAFFGTMFRVASVLLVICISTPEFLAGVIPMGAMYIYIQRYYIATSRELKRLDSTTRSPIFAHFQETLGGVSTIRAYNQQERFVFENEWRLDTNQRAYYPSISTNRWLAVRLEFIGSLIIFGASMLSVITVLTTGNIDAGLVGLSVSYALNVTQSLNWMVRQSSEVESNIVSVERMKEYIELEQEAPDVIEHNRPPQDWPTEGEIEFQDYKLRYRPGLDLVLKGISLKVDPGKKIGIVGRTGAGKSSLTLALFRLVEPAGGHIWIDGVRITDIGLHDLRSRLTIIPQDPVLFSGTIRENIDPTGKHDDASIWSALEGAYLHNHVRAMEGGLNSIIVQGGENFSMGQRQLLALARALLRNTKILFMDEASSACDIETDDLIQRSIRTAFRGCTILTIAHRIKTVMDSDTIVVLDKGSVAEYGTPTDLISDPKSLFFSLAREAGIIRDELEGVL